MSTLQSLYELSLELHERWSEDHHLNWEDAELLVSECRQVPSELLPQLPEIQSIVSYVESHDDWDSGTVANWPQLISGEIEAADATYHYREDGDAWEVYSLSLTGEKGWVGTLDTEALALMLVGAIEAKAPTSPDRLVGR